MGAARSFTSLPPWPAGWMPYGLAADPDRDLLWRQYALHVDLYKFYIEATIKINAFHYAITGAIVSFSFTHSDVSLARWALLPARNEPRDCDTVWLRCGTVARHPCRRLRYQRQA